MIPNIVQQVKDVEIPPLILGDRAFPLQTFMLKLHGDAIIPDNKRYSNYRNSRVRLVTEGAFRRLKMRLRVLFRKCKSNKETVKLYGLACDVPHNLCIKRSNLVPWKFDLTLDHASNKRLSPEEVKDALVLRSTNHKSFEVNKKSQTLKVRKALPAIMWKEKEGFLWIQMQHSLKFLHLNWNIWCILLYYCNCNYTILLLQMCAIFRCPKKIKKMRYEKFELLICCINNISCWDLLKSYGIFPWWVTIHELGLKLVMPYRNWLRCSDIGGMTGDVITGCDYWTNAPIIFKNVSSLATCLWLSSLYLSLTKIMSTRSSARCSVHCPLLPFLLFFGFLNSSSTGISHSHFLNFHLNIYWHRLLRCPTKTKVEDVKQKTSWYIYFTVVWWKNINFYVYFVIINT